MHRRRREEEEQDLFKKIYCILPVDIINRILIKKNRTSPFHLMLFFFLSDRIDTHKASSSEHSVLLGQWHHDPSGTAPAEQ